MVTCKAFFVFHLSEHVNQPSCRWSIFACVVKPVGELKNLFPLNFNNLTRLPSLSIWHISIFLVIFLNCHQIPTHDTIHHLASKAKKNTTKGELEIRSHVVLWVKWLPRRPLFSNPCSYRFCKLAKTRPAVNLRRY